MIYTDCEDSSILRQIIAACLSSESAGIITTSGPVARVAGDNMSKFDIFYKANQPDVTIIRLRPDAGVTWADAGEFAA